MRTSNEMNDKRDRLDIITVKHNDELIDLHKDYIEVTSDGRYHDWHIVLFFHIDDSTQNIIGQINEIIRSEICENAFQDYRMYQHPEFDTIFHIYCRTEKRKRHSTLTSYIHNLLDKIFDDTEFEDKILYDYRIDRLKRNYLKIDPTIHVDQFHLIESSNKSAEYTGRDIRILDQRENRYPWQNDVVDIVYDERREILRISDDRTIHWITDKFGCSGKSKLVKWLCVNLPDSISKISFGSANQLRSSLVGIGPRDVYFVDMPRTLGQEDNINNIITCLEDLKNGHIVSAMYGRSKTLLMDPPHVIVLSNKPCPLKTMTQDRWKIWQIESKTKNLIPYTYNQNKLTQNNLNSNFLNSNPLNDNIHVNYDQDFADLDSFFRTNQ